MTPTPEDYDRIAETLHSDWAGSIEDETTFQRAYDSYMDSGTRDPNAEIMSDATRRSVWQSYQNNFIKRKDKDLFKEAGGKDFKKDIKATSRTVVITEKDYIRKGAQRSDLLGYDTKRSFKRPTVKRLRHTFRILGSVKGRPSLAQRNVITWRGERVLRFRNVKGQFVKVK